MKVELLGAFPSCQAATYQAKKQGSVFFFLPSFTQVSLSLSNVELCSLAKPRRKTQSNTLARPHTHNTPLTDICCGSVALKCQRQSQATSPAPSATSPPPFLGRPGHYEVQQLTCNIHENRHNSTFIQEKKKKKKCGTCGKIGVILVVIRGPSQWGKKKRRRSFFTKVFPDGECVELPGDSCRLFMQTNFYGNGSRFP